MKGTKKGNPAATLNHNGVPVGIQDGVEVEVFDDYVQIKFKNIKKGDAGPWELNLGNTGGSVTAPFDLEVKGENF